MLDIYEILVNFQMSDCLPLGAETQKVGPKPREFLHLGAETQKMGPKPRECLHLGAETQKVGPTATRKHRPIISNNITKELDISQYLQQKLLAIKLSHSFVTSRTRGNPAVKHKTAVLYIGKCTKQQCLTSAMP